MGGSRWRVLDDLQVVFLGETHQKIPRHDMGLLDVAVNDHAFLAVQTVWHTPRGIAESVAGDGAARSNATHHPSQTFGPITGAECLTLVCHPKDDDFFGYVALHKTILGPGGCKHLTPHAPRINSSAPAQQAAEPISF